MKKLYFIKEKSGKWNFALVVNGKQIFESIKKLYIRQNYANFTDCKRAARRNVNYEPISCLKNNYEIKSAITYFP